MATTVIKQRFSRGSSNIIFSSLMRHKTEFTQDTLESSSQTSSGVTVWLSTADRSSPEYPEYPFFRITHMSNRIRCWCRDPRGGQRWVVNGTVLQCMKIILQQNCQMKRVNLCPDVHKHLALGLLTNLVCFWFVG